MSLLSITLLMTGTFVLASSSMFMLGRKITERKIFRINNNLTNDIPSYFQNEKEKREAYNKFEQSLLGNNEKSRTKNMNDALYQESIIQEKSEYKMPASPEPAYLEGVQHSNNLKMDFMKSKITYELLNPRMILVTLANN